MCTTTCRDHRDFYSTFLGSTSDCCGYACIGRLGGLLLVALLLLRVAVLAIGGIRTHLLKACELLLGWLLLPGCRLLPGWLLLPRLLLLRLLGLLVLLRLLRLL